MVEILKFDEAVQRRTGKGGSEPRHEEPFSFWPEVSSGLWVSNGPIHPDPMNSPQRVFREVLLILGGMGLLVLLTTAFLGMPH